MKEKIMPHELLLTNRAALAIALFLYRRNSKVDVYELEKAFGDKSKISTQLGFLESCSVISIGNSGRHLRPRIKLTDSGRENIELILAAANEKRQEIFGEMTGIPMSTVSNGIKITNVIVEGSDITIDDGQLKISDNTERLFQQSRSSESQSSGVFVAKSDETKSNDLKVYPTRSEDVVLRSIAALNEVMRISNIPEQKSLGNQIWRK